jgi:hypothetical protein
VFVGDSPAYVIAGRLAGVPVISHANKPGKVDVLVRAEADAVTADFAEVTAAFVVLRRLRRRMT